MKGDAVNDCIPYFLIIKPHLQTCGILPQSSTKDFHKGTQRIICTLRHCEERSNPENHSNHTNHSSYKRFFYHKVTQRVFTKAHKEKILPILKILRKSWFRQEKSV